MPYWWGNRRTDWSYGLINQVWPGDVVFHYSTRNQLIAGASVDGSTLGAQGSLGRPHRLPPFPPPPRPPDRRRHHASVERLPAHRCLLVWGGVRTGVALEDAERDLVMLALEESIPAPEIGVGQWGRLAVMNNDAPGRV